MDYRWHPQGKRPAKRKRTARSAGEGKGLKLPQSVKGQRKLRDAKIIRTYAKNEDLSMADVAKKFGLTPSRVQQIIYNNKELLKIDKNYENYIQVRRAKSQIGRKMESKKDILEWEAFLDRKLNGGDKTVLDQSNHYHFNLSELARELNDAGESRISGAFQETQRES